MRKASPWMLEKGIQNAIPFSRPHPRSKPQLLLRNLHGNWNIERGHVKSSLAELPPLGMSSVITNNKSF
jgi:hypothetical protein